MHKHAYTHVHVHVHLHVCVLKNQVTYMYMYMYMYYRCNSCTIYTKERETTKVTHATTVRLRRATELQTHRPRLLCVTHLHLCSEVSLEEAVEGLGPAGHIRLTEHLLPQFEIQPLHIRHRLVPLHVHCI